MNGPRTIKNFYYDKWSDYKTPEWSHTRKGMDSKSEYILRDIDDEFAVSESTNKIFSIIFRFRLIFFVLLLFSFDLYWWYKNRYLYKAYYMYKTTFFK
jgi:hypothetical protein